jgi:hypothetical protein
MISLRAGWRSVERFRRMLVFPVTHPPMDSKVPVAPSAESVPKPLIREIMRSGEVRKSSTLFSTEGIRSCNLSENIPPTPVTIYSNLARPGETG